MNSNTQLCSNHEGIFPAENEKNKKNQENEINSFLSQRLH